MQTYLNYLQDILDHGTVKSDRTGTGTLSVVGRQMRFNLEEGFPLVTTKKVHLKSIVHELFWFLKGSTNVKPLQEVGVSIWNEWANPDGELGPVYGKQWRSWDHLELLTASEFKTLVGKQHLEAGSVYDRVVNNKPRQVDSTPIQLRPGVTLTLLGVHKDNLEEGLTLLCRRTYDQMTILLDDLKHRPDSRRHIVSAWNVGELAQMALPPCHAFYQFFVNNGKLSCQLYQRSADSLLGVPFNIASYALLTHMIAQQAGLGVGDFIWTGGDCHIYTNHVEQVKQQLSRTPRPLPTLELRKAKDLFSYAFEDVVLVGYDPHPAIKAPIAV